MQTTICGIKVGFLALLACMLVCATQPAMADTISCGNGHYVATPCSAAPGATAKVVIQRNDGVQDFSLVCASVDPQGSKVSIPSSDNSQKAFWTGSIQVDPAAPVGPSFLLLHVYPSGTDPTSCGKVDPTKAVQELVPFSVTTLPPPGAIPTPQPQVDVAWKVLPRTVASDNFGSRVAKMYYAIVVYLGNNSGYDLQLSGVFFQVPGSGLTSPIPVDPYRVVRSSLQREQVVGLRNTTVNIIRGVGPILTGATPFFSGSTPAAKNHKTNFQSFISLFSNPFETGLELVFPDLTVNQLVALDNQALRDSVIISNNTSVPLLVFVDKGLLGSKGLTNTAAPNPPSGGNAGKPNPPGGTAGGEPNPSGGGNVGGKPNPTSDISKTKDFDNDRYKNKGKLQSTYKSDHDPLTVMRTLGDLQLVGKYVTYLDRVSLTAKAPGATQPPASPASKIISKSGDKQMPAAGMPFSPLVAVVTDAAGNPLSGVSVTFAGPASGATVQSFSPSATVQTDAQGQATVTPTANATAGAYNVTASVAGVTTPATFALTNPSK